jgi:hypothetical protein
MTSSLAPAVSATSVVRHASREYAGIRTKLELFSDIVDLFLAHWRHVFIVICSFPSQFLALWVPLWGRAGTTCAGRLRCASTTRHAFRSGLRRDYDTLIKYCRLLGLERACRRRPIALHRPQSLWEYSVSVGTFPHSACMEGPKNRAAIHILAPPNCPNCRLSLDDPPKFISLKASQCQAPSVERW